MAGPALLVAKPTSSADAARAEGYMFEKTFESSKAYADPFNDVDLDVIFSKDGKSWRVPTFWRGGGKWTVRFTPPSPGTYSYYLESSDKANPYLNGHEEKVTLVAYTGTNALLRHGMLRITANKRYFAHADGTPFYWLGDTWWTGLSDRLSWDGFRKLTADRKAKGFTVVQIVGGLIPSNEEQAPIDPGFHNEGGAVWDPDFKRINPQYFDYADRRVQYLVDSGIVPAIVGGWHQVLAQMGVPKMKQHWRYLIARYGAYPVFWIVGGEVYDPPAEAVRKTGFNIVQKQPGWSEVARYLRVTDPFHHPVTVHESPAPYDIALEDEALSDFDLLQPSHFGWPSIATEVAQITSRYARTKATKPIVQGEIGYERLGGQHLEDFQRTAFWLAMMNGAAGHTYGSIETAEAYSADKPFHRRRYSLLTWDELMNFPGSIQVGLGAKLLQQYPWHRFAPHPEWITPHGTTLFEPNEKKGAVEIDLFRAFAFARMRNIQPSEWDIPAGEWKNRNGTFRQPYAAGIPGEVRVIYMPYFGLFSPSPPTVLGLEPGVKYCAYYWDPSIGVKIDLGTVQRPEPGPVLFWDSFKTANAQKWSGVTKGAVHDGKLTSTNTLFSFVSGIKEADLVAAVDAKSEAEAALLFRVQDPDTYLAAIYSAKDKAIYFLDHKKGQEGPPPGMMPPLGMTPVPVIGRDIRLSAEVRGGQGIISVTDGTHTYTSPIVALGGPTAALTPPAPAAAGRVGLMHQNDGNTQAFSKFEVRQSPRLPPIGPLQRRLIDANGTYRGELAGPGWDNYGKTQSLLLDACLPERLPYPPDWVLVLERRK
jgi:hypothetical protein